MTSLVVWVVMGIATWLALFPRRWPWRAAVVLPSRRDRDRADRHPVGPLRPQRQSGHPHVGDQVPSSADLLAVALAAGASTAEALAEVGARDGSPGPLRSAANALERGNSLDDALGELGSVGHGWHPLATVLSLSTGTARGASEALRRFAASERLRLRRDRERRARRLPVLLLLPLTTMVLPAFVLATVVPFLVLGENPLRLPPNVAVTEGP